MNTVNMVDNAIGVEYTSENDLTVERLETLFELAYYKIEKHDGYIIVFADHRIFITIDSERSLLIYNAYIKIDSADDDLPNALLSVNNETIFAKLCTDSDGDVYTEYYIDYRGGIISTQIVNSMRRFDSITRTMVTSLRSIIDK